MTGEEALAARRRGAAREALAQPELPESDRAALDLVVNKLRNYRVLRVNEATVWARAIYPVLVLAERGSIRAWSVVPLAASLGDVEVRGEADGALAASIDEEVGTPCLVVIGAKRGVRPALASSSCTTSVPLASEDRGRNGGQGSCGPRSGSGLVSGFSG